MLRSSGKISVGLNQREGWYHLKCDNNIGAYYKKLYSLGGKTWFDCLNGCHITFIAGDRENRIISIKEMERWIGEEIEFFYDSTIYTNGRAFWLNIECEWLNRIRESYFLPRREFHLTLGNIKNSLK